MYWGALFGGSVTSILFNIPGEPSSVATTFDGYPMARDGRPTTALATAFGSAAFGALAGVVLITCSASWVARRGAGVRAGRIFRGLFPGLRELRRHGRLAADEDPGVAGDRLRARRDRHGHGLRQRAAHHGHRRAGEGRQLRRRRHGPVRHRRAADRGRGGVARQADLLARSTGARCSAPLAGLPRYWVALLRSAAIGCWMGITPGGPTAASFMSYGIAKRVSPRRANFGKGEPEGIIAPETADHAAGTSALLPMLSLGIPGSATAAVMMGGLMIWGLNPGTDAVHRAEGFRLGPDRLDVSRQHRRRGPGAADGADLRRPDARCRSSSSRR